MRIKLCGLVFVKSQGPDAGGRTCLQNRNCFMTGGGKFRVHSFKREANNVLIRPILGSDGL